MAKPCICISGKKKAQSNMDLDAQILATLYSESAPILHLYEWENKAITFGHFMKAEKWLNLPFIEQNGLDLAKRPTGGGFVFHTCDFAFSILIPASCPVFSLNTLENYAFINQIVIKVLRQFLSINKKFELHIEDMQKQEGGSSYFCMAKPTKYDVMLEGKKVAGAAQRRTKAGYLHQGTIFLTHLEKDFLSHILLCENVVKTIQENSYPLLGKGAKEKDLDQARAFLAHLFEKVFTETCFS